MKKILLSTALSLGSGANAVEAPVKSQKSIVNVDFYVEEFSLTITEARGVTLQKLIERARVKATDLNTGKDLISSVTADEELMQKLKNTRLPGCHQMTFTLKHIGATIQKTVLLVVRK